MSRASKKKSMPVVSASSEDEDDDAPQQTDLDNFHSRTVEHLRNRQDFLTTANDDDDDDDGEDSKQDTLASMESITPVLLAEEKKRPNRRAQARSRDNVEERRRDRSRSPSPVVRTVSRSPDRGPRNDSKTDWLDGKKGDMEHSDGPVPAPLFDGDWGDPSDDDSWCFMRDTGQTDEERQDNPLIQDILQFAKRFGVDDTYRLCVNIQKHYDKEFRAYQDQPRPWTLRSIRRWLEDTASKESMINMAIKIAHRKLLNMADTELCVIDPSTGQKRDCGDADMRLEKMMRVFHVLSKKK